MTAAGLWGAIAHISRKPLVATSITKARRDRHGNKRSMVARGLRAKAHGESYSDVLRKRFAANALKRVRS